MAPCLPAGVWVDRSIAALSARLVLAACLLARGHPGFVGLQEPRRALGTDGDRRWCTVVRIENVSLGVHREHDLVAVTDVGDDLVAGGSGGEEECDEREHGTSEPQVYRMR